jgi:hypothetical protein
MNEPNLAEMLIEVRDSVRDIKHNQDLIQQAHQQTHSEVVRLRRLIIGESEPERGLVLRVDRLEQRQERATFWSQTAVGVVITAVIGSILTAIGLKQ